MYKIGYVDDEKDSIKDYVKRLGRRDIQLLIAPEGDMKDILEWIVKNEIKCMLVDYQLNTEYDFNGTELVSYLNDELQGLPCMILTSYPESSINENLVISNNIVDRAVLDDDEVKFADFCAMLIQATKVFDKNMDKYRMQYAHLLKKKESGNLSQVEEEDFFDLYRILKSYGEIDDVPENLLRADVNEKLDILLKKLDNLLKK